MAISAAKRADERGFAVAAGGQGRVTALARHDSTARKPACHAEPRARTEYRDGLLLAGAVRAEEVELIGPQMRQAHADGFEVVDEPHRREPEFPLQLGGVDHPGGIGEPAYALLDRAGHREDGRVDRWHLGMVLQQAAQRRPEPGERTHVETMDGPELVVAEDRKAGVGAADIREEGAHQDTARAVSARIRSAYQRADSLGIRRWLG